MIDAVAADLASLESVSRVALAERWVAAFGCPAPRSCQAQLLRCALAWHAQMQSLHLSSGSREVDRAAQGLRRAASASAASSLSPGTRLLREWQGRTHHVTVLASGDAWSGPLFFGLRS